MTALTRRTFLSASAIGLAGCTHKRLVPPAALMVAARLPRVRVSADRVIRTIVGLRPFRESGFVVRAQKFDSKTVVHNYGHGGAGITLSWGTATLAADEARALGSPQACAVLGCGVMGLSTARVLQERGYAPTIYAKAMPPFTTSNVAGGLWEPVTVFDHARVTPSFRQQFVAASQIAFRRYQSLAGDRYAVRWMPLYSLSRDQAYAAPLPESPNYEVERLYPERRALTEAENPFPVPHAQRRQTMLIEPAVYLNALVRDFELAGGKIVIREFASASDLMSLGEELIFNCTGLGAGALFGDQELIPIRGQLVFLLPQPEIDYCTVGGGTGVAYMFPRKDGILLGGSVERNRANLEADPAITERIHRENGQLFSGMR